MKPLKTVLVGLGRVGFSFHLPELLSHPAFSLTAVVDPDETRRAEAPVKGYADLNSCLAAEAVDLCVIASPTHLHLEHALCCFRTGVDVFLDKPMTVSSLEASQLALEATKHNRRIMVYQPHRVTDEFTTARAIFESGKLGRIYEITRAVHTYTRRQDWQAFRKFGGGMLYNYGAHYIDQLLALTRATPCAHFCFTDRVASLGDAEDVVECMLKTKENILLRVSINQGTTHTPSPWVIYGTCGTAVFDPEKRVFTITRFDPESLPKAQASQTLAAEGRLYRVPEDIPWQTEEVSLLPPENYYDHCAAYFRDGASPFVPLSESVALMQLLDELSSCNLS